MNNKRVLCILRVSTDIQDLASQKSDMLDFLTAKGYSEDNIEWLEAKGASARKANKKYLDLIQTIINKTSGENGIKTVALWHLNRLGRIKKYLTDMEHHFVSNGVQMHVKQGFDMPLLDENGKETLGASIAFSVYSAMIEEDTKEMIEKMQRGKRELTKSGKYVGGFIHFGYQKSKDGKIEINKSEAAVVKMIFTMYASGQYSTNTLTDELNARGITYRGRAREDKKITLHFVTNMLNSTAFVGFTEFNGVRRVYPRIISDELFNKTQTMMRQRSKATISRRWNDDKTKKHNSLCNNLIVCPMCGGHFYVNSRSYFCSKHIHNINERTGRAYCENETSASTDWIDTAALYFAKRWERNWLFADRSETAEKAQQEIEINNSKIATLKDKINDIAERYERIKTLFIEGDITKTERDNARAKTQDSEAQYNDEIAKLVEANNNLAALVNYDKEAEIGKLGNLFERGINEDVEDNYKLTHKHIKNIKIESYELNGKEQKLITITGNLGNVMQFVYVSKSKVKDVNGNPQKLFLVHKETDTLIPLMITPKQIIA